MRSLRPMWVLVTLMCLAADPGRDAALAMGESYAERGQWRLAAQQYRGILEQNPKHRKATLGLGLALARISKCEESVTLLEGLRGYRYWNAKAAAAVGGCHLQMGDYERARAVLDEAVVHAPRSTEAWMLLAKTHAALNDEAGVDDAIVGLLLAPGGAELEAVLQAEISLRFGRPDLDGWLVEGRRERAFLAVLALHDARRWMDLGDPARADALLLEHMKSSMTNASMAFWRAEALRRQGLTASAYGVFQRGVFRQSLDEPLAAVLRSRVLVDLGELDAARALLATHPNPHEASALASMWYLTRAEGGDTTELERSWRSANRAERQLESLIPVVTPDTVGIPLHTLDKDI